MRTEELLQNFSAFCPLWKGDWEPDARMLDFEENGRPFTILRAGSWSVPIGEIETSYTPKIP